MKKLIIVTLLLLSLLSISAVAESPQDYESAGYLIDAWSGNEQITDLKGTSSENGAVLTWSAVPEAEGYIIGGIQNGQPYKQLGYVAGHDSTTYTDKDASIETYSYYWVFPYKRVNGVIARGKASSKYVYGIKLLPAPKNFMAQSVPTAVKLRWDPVPGVTRYLIKCKRGNGPVEVLQTVYTNEYSDTAAPSNVMSYYWVFALMYNYPKDIIGASSTFAYGKSIESGSGFRETGRMLLSYDFSNDTQAIILLHNDNGGTARVTANILAYDATGNIIGAYEDTWDCSEPGYTIALSGWFSGIQASQISRLSYTLSTSPSYWSSAQPYIKESHTIVGNKVIVSFTNTSNKEITSPYCRTIFLNGGNMVFSSNDIMYNSVGKLSPGATVVKEVTTYDRAFDSVIVVNSGLFN